MVRRSLHELGRYLDGVRVTYAVLGVLALLAGTMEAVVVVLVVYSALTMTGPDAASGPVPYWGEVTVGDALTVALGLGLAAIALHVMVARLCGRVTSDAVHATRLRLVEAYRDASWDQQLSGREGDLSHTIGVLTTQSGGVAFGLTNLVTNAMSVTALMAAALIVDPLATLVVLFCGTLVFVVIWPVRSVSGRIAGSLVSRVADITHGAAELDRLSLDLRTAGVDRRRADDLSESIRATAELDRRMRFLFRLGNNLYKDLAVLFLVGLVWLLHLSDGSLAIELGAVVVLVVRAVGNSQAIQNGLQNIQEHAPGLVAFGERLDRLRAAPVPSSMGPLDVVDGVEFCGVGFAHEPDRPVLADVSFEIERGESVGLVGPSGSGKTTLAHLLLRLREPDTGEIRVSGRRVDRIDPASFAALVGFVPQEPKLIDGTIADNIRFYRDGIGDDQIREAARRAHLLDVIENLPEGFASAVTGRTGLSGGQKQRLAIARALASDPDLVVLDEPTSALDGESEQAIAETLDELRGAVTLLVIAHRPTTVARCDRLVHLVDGRVERITLPGGAAP